jgi:hypothetical protein
MGKYNAANPINPGSNRWTFYPTVNYSWTPDKGATWLELYLSTKIFSTNGNFGLAGTSSLAQKPLYRAELHASRSLIPRLWVSGDAYYNVGGETRITEAYQGNAANTVRLGAGSGLRVWRGGEFVLNYEEVVARPSGQPVSRTYRITPRAPAAQICHPYRVIDVFYLIVLIEYSFLLCRNCAGQMCNSQTIQPLTRFARQLSSYHEHEA